MLRSCSVFLVSESWVYDEEAPPLGLFEDKLLEQVGLSGDTVLVDCAKAAIPVIIPLANELVLFLG